MDSITTAWAIHLEEPATPGVIGDARIWTGFHTLLWMGEEWMPTYGVLDVLAPGDAIGAGYEHARITITWPRVDHADFEYEVPKIDFSDLGLREGQGCHIWLLESFDDGRTWRKAPGATDYHGKATGFEAAESSAVIDVTPLSGDIDAAKRLWWSADDRAAEAQAEGFLDNSMRYMRRIGTRLLSRFPGGPTRYEDDYTP